MPVEQPACKIPGKLTIGPRELVQTSSSSPLNLPCSRCGHLLTEAKNIYSKSLKIFIGSRHKEVTQCRWRDSGRCLCAVELLEYEVVCIPQNNQKKALPFSWLRKECEHHVWNCGSHFLPWGDSLNISAGNLLCGNWGLNFCRGER